MTITKPIVVWQGELTAFAGSTPKTMRVVVDHSIAFKDAPVFYVEERELDRAGNERWSDRRLDEAGDVSNSYELAMIAMLPRRAVACALIAMHANVTPSYSDAFDGA